jgi:hypothetical protein
MLVRADDGAVDNQLFEITAIRHRLEETAPDTLLAPTAEAPKDAVSIAEHIRQVTPGRASSYDPQHRLREHAIVASRRTSRTIISDNILRQLIPLVVTKNQTIQDTHHSPPKAVMNHITNRLVILRVRTP